MRSTLVYDLPIRLFHWLFSGLFLLSFVIAKAVDDESMIFSYHMLSGLLLGGLVIWRIVWGIIGSEHARFSGFNLNPLHLKDYFWGILGGSKQRWPGHNPASSWAAVSMFSLSLGLAITGYLMSTGRKESFEDIHEFMANTFIVVVVLHVAGVILHSIRHQDAISLSMIDGKKEIPDAAAGIQSSRRVAAILLLALVISTGLYLFKNFDSQNRTLNAFGQTLQLGENENDEGENEGDEQKAKNSDSSQKDEDGDDD
jgi:cytochrome b